MLRFCKFISCLPACCNAGSPDQHAASSDELLFSFYSLFSNPHSPLSNPHSPLSTLHSLLCVYCFQSIRLIVLYSFTPIDWLQQVTYRVKRLRVRRRSALRANPAPELHEKVQRHPGQALQKKGRSGTKCHLLLQKPALWD